MTPRKLIFLVTDEPAAEGSALETACHWATVAARAGVEAELRLAGDAVLVADPVHVASVAGPARVRDRVAAAVVAGVEVSACPRSAETRGVPPEQLAALGARPRPLGEVFAEAAAGRAVLVPVGRSRPTLAATSPPPDPFATRTKGGRP